MHIGWFSHFWLYFKCVQFSQLERKGMSVNVSFFKTKVLEKEKEEEEKENVEQVTIELN